MNDKKMIDLGLVLNREKLKKESKGFDLKEFILNQKKLSDNNKLKKK